MTSEQFAKWLRNKLVEQLKAKKTTTRSAANMMREATKMHRSQN